ncbi:MAG: OB-fold nucleic acid binding domain-containing protein, partial [Armatimonadota bacterium]
PVGRDILENLILCGAFDTLHPNRRQLFWRLGEILRQAVADATPLYDKHDEAHPVACGSFSERLDDFSDFEKFRLECDILGVNVTCHVMAYYRDALVQVGAVTSADLLSIPSGRRVRVGGVVIRPHRPPTRSGRVVVFLSLEDETGLADITVFEDVYQRYGNLIYSRPALIVEGVVDRRGSHPSVTAEKVWELPASWRDEACRARAPQVAKQG